MAKAAPANPAALATAVAQTQAAAGTAQGARDTTAALAQTTQVLTDQARGYAAAAGASQITSDLDPTIDSPEVAFTVGGRVVLHSKTIRDNIASLFGGAGAPTLTSDLVADPSLNGALVFRNANTGGHLAVFPAGGGSPASGTTATIAMLHDATTGCTIETRDTLLATTNGVVPRNWIVPRIGQSLDRGGGVGASVISSASTNPTKVRMLSAGIMPFGDTSTGLVPAVESQVHADGEIGMVSFANRMCSLTQAAVGAMPNMIVVCEASGGQPIENLRRGSPTYTLLMKDIFDATTFSKAEGRTSFVPFIHGNPGNANSLNTSRRKYARSLVDFRRSLQEDIRQIQVLNGLPPQPEPVLLYISQPDSGTTGKGYDVGTCTGMFDATELDPYIILLPPHYDLPRDSGETVHPSSASYFKDGERKAEAIFRHYLCDQYVAMYPQKAGSYWSADGKTYYLLMPTLVPPLVVDANGPVNIGNGLPPGGIDFTDFSASPPTVTGVAVSTGTVDQAPASFLAITLSAVPTGSPRRFFGGMRVPTDPTTQAIWVNGNGPVGGSRMNLRDSATAVSALDGGAIPNYVCRFVHDA